MNDWEELLGYGRLLYRSTIRNTVEPTRSNSRTARVGRGGNRSRYGRASLVKSTVVVCECEISHSAPTATAPRGVR